jgi:hypothetical protein
MQVRCRCAHGHLQVAEPAQPIAERGQVVLVHRRVRDEDGSAPEQFGVVLEKLLQVNAADLLFALQQQLDVERGSSRRTDEVLQRFDVGEELPFVIGRSTGVDTAVTQGRLKWGSFPQLQWIGGLHIVVPVDQHRWQLRRALPFGVDERMPGGGEELNPRGMERVEMLHQPLRARRYALAVCRVGADAGEAQQLSQLR